MYVYGLWGGGECSFPIKSLYITIKLHYGVVIFYFEIMIFVLIWSYEPIDHQADNHKNVTRRIWEQNTNIFQSQLYKYKYLFPLWFTFLSIYTFIFNISEILPFISVNHIHDCLNFSVEKKYSRLKKSRRKSWCFAAGIFTHQEVTKTWRVQVTRPR